MNPQQRNLTGPPQEDGPLSRGGETAARSGLVHVAAASERYRLAVTAYEDAQKAKDDARANLEAVCGAAWHDGAAPTELEPFYGAVSALHAYVRHAYDAIARKAGIR